MNRMNKAIRCPFNDKNQWIVLETEADIEGNEVLLCMTCKEKDSLVVKGVDCDTQCVNYFD